MGKVPPRIMLVGQIASVACTPSLRFAYGVHARQLPMPYSGVAKWERRQSFEGSPSTTRRLERLYLKMIQSKRKSSKVQISSPPQVDAFHETNEVIMA